MKHTIYTKRLVLGAFQLLLGLLLFTGLATNAQTTTKGQPKVVTLDFQTMQFTDSAKFKLNQLSMGDYYQIKIVNLNKNLYTVSIGKQDSMVSKPLPVPTFAGFGVGSLKDLIDALGPIAISGVAPPVPTAREEQLATASADLLSSDRLHSLAMEEFVLKNYHTRITPEELAKALIEGDQQILRQATDTLFFYKRRIDDLYFSYNKFLIRSQVEFATAATAFSTNGLSLDSLYHKLTVLRKQIEQLGEGTQKRHAKYLEDSKQYAKTIEATPALKKGDEAVKSAYQELTSTLLKAQESISAENTVKFINSIVAVMNNNSTEYLSMPMQFTKERTTLKLSIIPRNTALLQSYSTELVFPTDERKRFWGVSSGFYVSTLHNEAYSTKMTVSTTQDTLYSMVNEQPAKMEFGLNAMIRYGWKLENVKAKNTFWQFGFGPAVSLSDKVRPRVAVATGVAIGDKHKFLIDVGLILGNNDRKSRVYNENENYTSRPGAVTVSKLQAGAFLSLGYLFY